MRIHEQDGGLDLDTPREPDQMGEGHRNTTHGTPRNIDFQETLANFLPVNFEAQEIQLTSKFTLPQLKGQPIPRPVQKELEPDVIE